MTRFIPTKLRHALGSYKARARASYNRRRMRRRGGFDNGSRIVTYHGGDQGNEVIRRLIERPGPAMISRYGDVELNMLWAVLTKADPDEITKRLNHLHRNAGFFPADPQLLDRFVTVYEEAARQIDCLAIWNFEHGRWAAEETMYRDYSPGAALISIRSLESWLFSDPWTAVLEGKDVLVVHPFDESIRRQYEKRTKLFEDERVLPRFASLQILKAVHSHIGNGERYETWFDALESMRARLDTLKFDVALIGAGAYGLPLAAHIKELGKKAVHMGGVTQILFGIIGKRWEKAIPGGYPPLTRFVNDDWARPLREETPARFGAVGTDDYW